jgi:hypothetical protein
MCKIIAVAVLAISLTACKLANATPDVCEVMQHTAELGQEYRQAGVTAEQIKELLNTVWLPAAREAGMGEWVWRFTVAGFQHAYNSDPEATHRAVGNSAFHACKMAVI